MFRGIVFGYMVTRLVDSYKQEYEHADIVAFPPQRVAAISKEYLARKTNSRLFRIGMELYFLKNDSDVEGIDLFAKNIRLGEWASNDDLAALVNGPLGDSPPTDDTGS